MNSSQKTDIKLCNKRVLNKEYPLNSIIPEKIRSIIILEKKISYILILFVLKDVYVTSYHSQFSDHFQSSFLHSFCPNDEVSSERGGGAPFSPQYTPLSLSIMFLSRCQHNQPFKYELHNFFIRDMN